MKQTIEIEVPDGKKAIWKDNKVVFEGIKPQLPKTWGEFCNEHEITSKDHFIGNDSTICYWLGTMYRQYTCKNMVPSEKAAKQHLALMQLHQLRDCYRQGWLPDWNKDSTKYCIEKLHNSYVVDSIISLPYFLAFQSNEIAKEFLNNFRDLIEEAGDLI